MRENFVEINRRLDEMGTVMNQMSAKYKPKDAVQETFQQITTLSDLRQIKLAIESPEKKQKMV